ncbi:MAG TPA: sigma-70 family RNA polymerase sigma factor [Pyrinomonadaceae bacterium]|jgi:RNA polymerase sigma-70 factor (ECF subfamily)
MKEVGPHRVELADPVEQLREGESPDAAFRRVFETYYPPVFRFFEKRNFPSDQCHDLTQETFIRVYNNIGTFRREAPFGAWLFQIAANVFRNTLRQQSTQKRAGQHLSLVEVSAEDGDAPFGRALLVDESAQNPLEDVLRVERSRILREAVESLPEQMRRCMMLRVYQDLSYQQIAVVMRVSVETVKSHLYQARQQLKEKMADYFEDFEI